jgi:hypothetical protein
MKHPLWFVALLILTACGTAHTGTQVRSAPPAPVIHSSSTSFPLDPSCNKPGVLERAKAIADLSTRDVPGALAALRAASPDVRQCMSHPTGESSESGVQQVSP